MQDVILKALGLITNPNELIVPPGALFDAVNVLIRQPGLIQSVRGSSYLAMTNGHHSKMFPYDETLIGHFGGSVIKRLTAPTWTVLTGAISAPVIPGIRMRASGAGKNLYLTSSVGVKRLSGATGAVAQAGVPRALGLERAGYPATCAIGGLIRAIGIVTATTSAAHGFTVGISVQMDSAGEAQFQNGYFVITAVPSATTFTYADATGNETISTAEQTFRRPILSAAATGALPDQFQCAYFVVFALRDAKGNTHFGSPSARTIIQNNSFASGYSNGNPANVTCRLMIPSGVDSAFFFQVYRTNAVALGTNTGEDAQLVFQDYIKTSDVTRGYAEFTDIYPDTLKGAFIYTAPTEHGGSAGNGTIGQVDGENEPPPYCEDICFYKNRQWFARTVTRHLFGLGIASVGGANGIQNGDQLIVDGVTFTATTGALSADKYRLVTTGAADQNNEATALNLVECINKHVNPTVHAHYVGNTGLQSSISIEKIALNTSNFYVLAKPGSRRACFNPVLIVDNTAPVTLSRAQTGTTVTATVASPLTGHSYFVGELVTLGTGDVHFPAGAKTITAVTATTFTYEDISDSNAYSLASQDFSLASSVVAKAESSADARDNGLSYSKPGEFEAVPWLNFFPVGMAGSVIYRVISLADQIVIVASDGFWRLIGEDVGNFSIVRINDTVRPLGRDTVCALGNAVYALTNVGVVKIAASGQYDAQTGTWSGQFSIVSGAIRNKIEASMMACGETAIQNYAFGLAHPTEHVYELWLPSTPNSTNCLTAYILNTDTGAWTTRAVVVNGVGVSYGKTCGCHNPVDGLMYLGDNYAAGGDSATWKERKALADSDFQDETVMAGPPLTYRSYGIAKTVTYVFETADAPAMMKRFAEVTALFMGTPSAITIAYANEYGSAGSNALLSNNSQAFRDYVRPDATLGTRLKVTITHSVQSEAFILAGLAVKFEVLGPSMGR